MEKTKLLSQIQVCKKKQTNPLFEDKSYSIITFKQIDFHSANVLTGPLSYNKTAPKPSFNALTCIHILHNFSVGLSTPSAKTLII